MRTRSGRGGVAARRTNSDNLQSTIRRSLDLATLHIGASEVDPTLNGTQSENGVEEPGSHE